MKCEKLFLYLYVENLLNFSKNFKMVTVTEKDILDMLKLFKRIEKDFIKEGFQGDVESQTIEEVLRLSTKTNDKNTLKLIKTMYYVGKLK